MILASHNAIRFAWLHSLVAHQNREVLMTTIIKCHAFLTTAIARRWKAHRDSSRHWSM